MSILQQIQSKYHAHNNTAKQQRKQGATVPKARKSMLDTLAFNKAIFEGKTPSRTHTQCYKQKAGVPDMYQLGIRYGNRLLNVFGTEQEPKKYIDIPKADMLTAFDQLQQAIEAGEMDSAIQEGITANQEARKTQP